ncbi:MAG TPA: potassium transporter [Spirochaetaceae bacterium]|jgi:trk system potassium uptake protein TrkH|nr:potassium transporter [Spirochaetaceae bacterium]
MNFGRKSDTSYLLSFFIALIGIGALLLWLPAAWSGTSQYAERLPFADALFTATSAVCVTGLVTVDTADFTRFGQIVIMALIQLGGLGIISFTSILLIVPGRRLPFRRLKTIRSYSVDGVEHDPVKIVRNIVLFTIAIETLGAIALYWFFEAAGTSTSAFSAAFHAISAFCNAGFSLFPDSLERFKGDPALLAIISLLIVTGGIGFIVLQDIAGLMRGKKKRLSYHTKVILIATFILIVGGATAFFLLERDHAFAGMSLADRLANALFQSITPRTAGFNAVHQTDLRQPSKLLTILFMFIGGAPGSIAGGIKIATAYIVLLVMLKRANERGEINSFGRRISAATINTAVVYFIKAVFLLILAAGVLSLFEASRGADLGHIVFEVASAFGTVGLSLDFTAGLSLPGKLVIVATMFSGRVGLIAFVFFGSSNTESYVYPEADILIG